MRTYPTIDNILLDTWLPEVFALGFSTACLLAIIAVLAAYHDKQLHRLPKGLTLNAIIAVLAAGAKSSLMFAVGGTMSRSKWCWFRHQQRLQDLEDMDDASRGPLGSTVMIFQHTIRSICAIGAVLVILALAFDPFVQQVVGYPVRQATTSSSEALTRQAHTLNSVTATDEMAGNVYAGIYHDNYDRTPTCPTGNCTWDPFRSVGWCGECKRHPPGHVKSDDCNFSLEDLIDGGHAINKECHFSISGGDSLLAVLHTTVDQYGNNSGYLQYSPIWLMTQLSNPVRLQEYAQEYFTQDHMLLDHRNPLLAFGYIYFQYVTAKSAFSSSKSFDIRTPLPQMMNATSCVLTPYARLYNVTVMNGNTTVEVLNEDYGTLSAPRPNEYYSGLCWRPTSLAALPPTNISVIGSPLGGLSYNDTNMAWCGLASEWIPQIAAPLQGAVGINFMRDVRKADSVAVSMHTTHNTPAAHIDDAGGLHKVFPGIINALTDATLHATEFNNNIAVSFVNGTVLTEKVFVHVIWGWLSLPIALIVGGAIFLGLTVWDTGRHKVPLWKSSATAFLYHGLSDDAVDADSEYATRSEMEEAARSTRVRLNAGQGRPGRVMLQA